MIHAGHPSIPDVGFELRCSAQQYPAYLFRQRANLPLAKKRKRQTHLVSPVMVAAQEALPKSVQGPTLRTFDTKSMDKAQLSKALTRPRIDFDSILHTVRKFNCSL